MSNPLPKQPAGLRQQVPLAPFSTIGIGGQARYFLEATTLDQLHQGLEWCKSEEIPLFVLGGGSNILVSDEGFAGLVMHMALKGIEGRQSDGSVLLRAAAGEEWDQVVEHSVAQGWAGVEGLSGIPGLVGATPLQNVGAYGQEIAESVETIEVVDRQTGRVQTFEASACEFGYRTSRFKAKDRGRFIITAASFRLSLKPPQARYAELERYLREQNLTQPDCAQMRQAVLAIRKRKSMVYDPCDPDSRSCGSFFVNPIVDKKRYEQLLESATRRGLISAEEKMPAYESGQGQMKLSAAWLIEHSGLKRGFRQGNVALSSKHVLAIVNCGQGRAQEVLALMELVRQRVFDSFGVRLEPEPVFVGFPTAAD